jgi:asparagine synthase (glutamine-hydrolysing)
MCGIAGIYAFSKASVVTVDALTAMTNAIVHRGPDGEGHWINASANVGFGHRRLSIIDLSEYGKQPMHYANERYTITFNGEIYNYIELKNELITKGYTFTSNSDTEVLLALYDLKKENCLHDLDGMFAFAIWDEQQQQLFCARDRFGEKPFHYYFDNDKFIFASEIKQFWAEGIAKKINEQRLLHFATTGNVENETNITHTFYNHIHKLDAAHYVIINVNKAIAPIKYWDIDLNATPFTGTLEQAAEQFLHLFTNSIKLRLRSDVPVGSSLSGGLDSSSIVLLIDALKGKELQQNTFSARFKNFAKDEGEHIETVLKACKNMAVHYTWPDAAYFETVFDKVTYHQDEPYASVSIVAQYAVMELAKQHNVTVLLDGQGADEYLGGYLYYYQYYLNQLFYNDKRTYNAELIAYNNFHNAAEPYSPITDNETLRMKIGRYKKTLFNEPMPYSNNLNEELKKSTTQAGLKELLRYADRNSMAHSREVRLPFLSHKLVEFVFSLPNEFKINKGWTKFILRTAMQPTLPRSINWRVDKIGYEPPQAQWLKSERFTHQINAAANTLQLPIVNDTKNVFTQNWRLLMAANYL